MQYTICNIQYTIYNMQYCSKTYENEKGKKCHLLKVAMLKRIATHLIQIFLNSYDDFSQHIQD